MSSVLLVLAFLVFVLAALGVLPVDIFRMIAVGLSLWTGSELVRRL